MSSPQNWAVDRLTDSIGDGTMSDGAGTGGASTAADSDSMASGVQGVIEQR